MSMRPKTKRRLSILILVSLIVVVAMAGVYVLRQRQLNAALNQRRADGMGAYEAGDYVTALEHLSGYVARRKDDADALFAYGKSRVMVETERRRNIVEGMGIFRRYLELRPDDVRGMHELIDLYVLAQYKPEAVALAEKVLARQADDPKALRALALSLGWMERYEEALAACLRLNEVSPTDLEPQRWTFDLMARVGKSNEEVLERARKLREAHPDDPRFELLHAWAYVFVNDAANAQQSARALATRTPPDGQFVAQLVELLDLLKMNAEADALLERSAAAQHADRQIMRVLVQRMWQSGRHELLVERLKDLPPQSLSSDTQLLAMRALALYQLDRPDEAEPIVEALSQRSGDMSATAWAMALRTRFGRPAPEPRQAIEQYKAALVRDGNNEIIRFMLGEGYAQLGEHELALQVWAQVMEKMPRWSTPAVAIVRVMVATNRASAGVEIARRSYRRNQSVPLAIALATARFAERAQGGDIDAAELLRLVQEIQSRLPGEPQTLPIYVALLAEQQQHEQAVAAARAALQGTKPLAEETLLRLAAANHAYKLGLEELIHQRLGGRDASSPQAAMAQAAQLLSSGQGPAGLALLRSAAERAGNTLPWRVAVARYREQIADPDVHKEWITLGDQNPDDLPTQLAALDSSLKHKHRQFWQRTIDRVKKLTGDEAIRWRLERAEWLLGSAERERDSAEAVVLLSDIVRGAPGLSKPRLLLARALQSVGNAPGAIEQLRVAADMNPHAVELTLSLARLLQSEGRFEEARTRLSKLADEGDLAGEQTAQVAAMLAQMGELRRAVTLLEKASDEGPSAARETLLAELCRRQGRIEQARGLYQSLLERPELNATVLQAAAHFFASLGEMETARQALKRLETAKVPAGVLELMQAEFSERYVSRETAQEQYQAATRAAPSESATWVHLAGFYLRGRQFDDAAAAADQGIRSAGADDPRLQSLTRQIPQLKANASNDGPFQSLLEVISRDPPNESAESTLATLEDLRVAGATAEQRVSVLRQLGERHPRFLPLQGLLMQACRAAGRTEEAVTIATRVMEASPDPDSAKLAVQLFATIGRWQEMLVAARKWRQRTLEHPQPADLAIAEAHLRQGQAADAVKVLEPYIPAAVARADEHAALLQLYAWGLILVDRRGEAASLLEPLARRSATWRGTWLSLPGLVHADPAVTADWIKQVAPLVPDAPEEQFTLAYAWYDAGLRDKASPTALETARDILIPLAQRSDVRPAVPLLLASTLEQLGDLPGAVSGYRRALELDPNLPVAQNNLAFTLLSVGGDLSEARDLAVKATTTAPGVANFHDTLARIEAKLGHHDASANSFQQALRLQPNNVEALIGLAEALTHAGRAAEAREILERVDAMLRLRDPHLPPAAQQQLDAVRSALSKAS